VSTVGPGAGRTVGAVLADRVAARPAHPFVVCDDERLTYGEADRASRALARGLLGSGVGRGTHVGLCFPTGVDFVVAWLACARIGAVTVPISTFSTADELATLVRDADLGALLTVPEYRGNDFVASLQRALPGLDLTRAEPVMLADAPYLRRVFVMGDAPDVDAFHTGAALRAAAAGVEPGFVDRVGADVGPDDRMVIVHTSGSTSAPKGVVHTHGGLCEHLDVLNGVRGLTADMKMFSNSPMFWIGGMGFNLVGTLMAGSTLVCSRAEDPAATLDLVEREQPEMVNGFAQSVAVLVSDPSFPARDFSFIRTGNLYPIMPKAMQPPDTELRHNMLGMTETGSVALMDPDESDQPERHRGSFGRPVPDLEARVVDVETGRDCAPGELGELWFRGPNLMEGYYGREHHEVFTPDEWFRTGDLCTVDDEGYFYFRGRRGDMIKTAGANVSPREVEPVLREVTGCEYAIVFGLPDEERGQIVAAVLVEAEDGMDDDALRAALRDRLSAYKVPRRFLRLSRTEVPMLSSAKPDMPAVMARFDE
jgi:acyl-CoA synthetase (AMP-forming)/AMP-acid ligase II